MSEERIEGGSVAWQPAAAAACFVVAVLALVIGFVLTTSRLLDFQLHPLLHGLGLALLVIGIPILILGAHFMDLRERKVNRGSRREAVISR